MHVVDKISRGVRSIQYFGINQHTMHGFNISKKNSVISILHNDTMCSYHFYFFLLPGTVCQKYHKIGISCCYVENNL